MEVVSTSFLTFGNEPVISIIIRCRDEEWEKLLSSTIGIFWNPMFGGFGLLYDFDRTFMPGVIIDNESILKTLIDWLEKVVSNKKYYIQYVRLTENGALNTVVTIRLNDTKFIEDILDELKRRKK